MRLSRVSIGSLQNINLLKPNTNTTVFSLRKRLQSFFPNSKGTVKETFLIVMHCCIRAISIFIVAKFEEEFGFSPERCSFANVDDGAAFFGGRRDVNFSNLHKEMELYEPRVARLIYFQSRQPGNETFRALLDFFAGRKKQRTTGRKTGCVNNTDGSRRGPLPTQIRNTTANTF